MKKIAMVFILAVFIPSLALAWLAVRSLHDQQLVLERQQSLLAQDQADALARAAADFLDEQQAKFARTAELLMEGRAPADSAAAFDKQIRALWPPAEVGFVVTLAGKMLCPAPGGGLPERKFIAENGGFTCNLQGAEVYAGNNGTKLGNNFGLNGSSPMVNQSQTGNNSTGFGSGGGFGGGGGGVNQLQTGNGSTTNDILKSQAVRVVTPSQQTPSAGLETQSLSKISASHAEFRDLVADAKDGRVARYVDNRLNLLIWHRADRDPEIIFGAQLSLPRMREFLAPLARQLEPTLRNEFAAAILDDDARPVSVSRDGFQANWRRPLAATEIGEALPHWEMALYLVNPGDLARSARALALTLGLLVAVLLVAIGVGSWLIGADLRRQLAMARQKTDFVSNVSHELKTPLTSIRMFSELLAAGRVAEPAKQRDYLNIISVEAARLTRLINNVLDFSRMERGERHYRLEDCDLAAVARETVETFRPHLEASQFQFAAVIPDGAVMVRGDRDALAQVLVNLLSNAEKYSPDTRDIELHLETRTDAPVEISILDRGKGVPRGFEEKIFEQFFRVDDSLSASVPGSGLGLTLARQIARAHGGDVTCRVRDGGGSCFTLTLPG